MTDPEREHFVRQIRDLERRLRRWRLTSLALLGLLLLPVVLGGLLGIVWALRLERERAVRQGEMEREAAAARLLGPSWGSCSVRQIAAEYEATARLGAAARWGAEPAPPESDW